MEIGTPMTPNNFGSKLKDYIHRRKKGLAGPMAIRPVGLAPADLAKIKSVQDKTRSR